ncbi:MAG: hypothetical protein R3F60_22660 [bacterium]
MSRGYRIRWREAVTRVTERGTVAASDRLELGVELLPILPEAEMVALLREALCDDGWSPSADGGLVRQLPGGAEARLAADGRSVQLRIEGTRAVQATADTQVEAQQALSRNEVAARERLAAELAQRLDRAEADLQGSLADHVQRIYVRALKEKAARLGEVTSIDERTDEAGGLELTIKVKV